MASFRVDGLDETIRELERLGRMDEVAPKAVKAAAPILEKAVKGAVSSAVTEGNGDLVRSIKATKVRENDRGYYVVVKPNGNDRKGTSNSDKLLHLEYGTSHQPPKPCLQAAVVSSSDACISKMEEVIAKELGLE